MGSQLMERVTFEGVGEKPVDVDFKAYGATCGRDGKITPQDRDVALKTAGIIHGAKTKTEERTLLGVAFEQDGEW
jgi:hypothetical protein